jgi:hypothetical protein
MVLPEASSEADTDRNDARPRLAGTHTGAGYDARTELTPTDPGPFQDIPQGVWIIFLSAWALVFTLFILFFAVTPAAAFVVTIAALFALMAFGLPAAMAAQGRCEGHECRGVVHTRTGRLSVAAAGTQIVLIPVAAVIGLTAFIIFVL